MTDNSRKMSDAAMLFTLRLESMENSGYESLIKYTEELRATCDSNSDDDNMILLSAALTLAAAFAKIADGALPNQQVIQTVLPRFAAGNTN